MLKATHRHDCDGCVLVGQMDGEDVYHCDHVDLIRRFGDSPEDNASLPLCVLRNHSPRPGKWSFALALYKSFVAGRENRG